MMGIEAAGHADEIHPGGYRSSPCFAGLVMTGFLYGSRNDGVLYGLRDDGVGRGTCTGVMARNQGRHCEEGLSPTRQS